MEALRIIPDLERHGIRDEPYNVVEYDNGPIIIGGMSKGTENGKPVVMIAIDTDDGDVMVIQTTLALFLSAADALKAYHGDPR
jgi:hypothetical protein